MNRLNGTTNYGFDYRKAFPWLAKKYLKKLTLEVSQDGVWIYTVEYPDVIPKDDDNPSMQYREYQLAGVEPGLFLMSLKKDIPGLDSLPVCALSIEIPAKQLVTCTIYTELDVPPDGAFHVLDQPFEYVQKAE